MLGMVPSALNTYPTASIHAITTMLTSIVLLGSLAVRKSCTLRWAEYVIVWLAVNYVFIFDFRTYGRLGLWTLFVPVMDLLLLCHGRSWLVSLLMYFSLAYLTFTTMEYVFHFGVYDQLPDLTSVEKPTEACRGRWENLFNRLLSFVSDFIMTRHFANTMHTEQTRIRRSVELAQKVAEALVRF
eukprot:Sspe_Gene.119061::Locus_113987_Transcript_3_3_Confidence_0.667_Length_692::g.119061::m.119061